MTQTDNVELDCNGFTISSDSGYGLIIEGAKNVRVKNCRFHGQQVGVLVDHAYNFEADSLDISATTTGIRIEQTPYARIENSQISAAKGTALSGIDISQSDRATIENVKIDGFKNTGINLYAAWNFDIRNCTISHIGDSGIGFFEREGHPPTGPGIVRDNRIDNIRNVAALEIMHGTHDVKITGNTIDSSHSALMIYDKGAHGPIEKINFQDNKIERSLWPLSIQDAKQISIIDNRIARGSGGVLSISKSTDLAIEGNRFSMNQEGVAIGQSTENLRFLHNRFETHFGHFLQINEKPVDALFVGNYWDGCPAGDRFFGIVFPDAINPILLPKPGTDEFERYPLSDTNSDGVDDFNCEGKGEL
jgi:parallel beta-helix repeat protein